MVRVSNLDLSWHEALDGVNKLLDRLLGHIKQSILHDELSLAQELLKLSDLIHLFGGLVEVEPGLSDDTGLLEVVLDDFLNLVHPGLSQVIRGLGNRGTLDLLELIDSHSLGDVWVVDVLHEYIVTLFSDLLLGSDNLVLVL